MKKFLSLILASSIAFSAFAEDSGPELLKKKELFEKTELFEPQSVFANQEANLALLKDYEANKGAYKPTQLMPVAVCYLTFNAFPQAKETFEAFLATSPKNKRALRTLGTISLLTKNTDKAIEYYKRAVDAGDERANIFLGSAYIMAQKTDQIKNLLLPLKKLAAENLEAFNVVMLYAMRDNENHDKDLMKETVKAMDTKKVMASATPDGLSTVARIYLADRDVWTPSSLVIPARAAALMDVWLLARQCYRDVLKVEPNNTLALRGMGLVEYRTGDVTSAAKYIMDAYKKGDKDAAVDGFELFLLSKRPDIWKEFKGLVGDVKFTPQLRAGLVQYAVNNDGNAEMFYMGALGENTDLLYKDANVRNLLKLGVEKYASDKRAKSVAERIKKASDEVQAQKTSIVLPK